MLSNDTKGKITTIVSGAILEGSTDYCTAIRNHICSSFETSTMVKANFESNAVIKKDYVNVALGLILENRGVNKSSTIPNNYSRQEQSPNVAN